ncbi:MAG: hypothetical protein D6706_20030 [Chloroflexi bacterium]|nr:MAG: hypothetical protein D6706_20030 [Chloroflexota bacterium]
MGRTKEKHLEQMQAEGSETIYATIQMPRELSEAIKAIQAARRAKGLPVKRKPALVVDAAMLGLSALKKLHEEEIRQHILEEYKSVEL